MSRPQLVALPSQLGAVLRASRKAHNMSQAEVAHHIGLSQKRVSFLELHPEHLSAAQLMAWCATLGLELFVAAKPASQDSGASASEW
jgi:HTH-type transcriptional regulator/antitoxin HipB